MIIGLVPVFIVTVMFILNFVHCEITASYLILSYLNHTVVTLQTHHACLYLVSLRQTTPPLIVIAAI